MKVLVTGGAGFIGSHVVDAYIRSGHEVVVVDDFSTGRHENLASGIRVHEMDVGDKSFRKIVSDVQPEVVNHHAAQVSVGLSVENPAEDARLNILGSLAVFEACAQAGVRRLIFSSSGGAIYGDQKDIPCVEIARPIPRSPYGIAKYASEHYLRYYGEVWGLRSVVLRYSNVYGPRQQSVGEAGVISIFCKRILDGEPLAINGDGDQTRDFVFVEDAARANIQALEFLLSDQCMANGGEVSQWIFNIGTGTETTINQLANYMIQVAERPIRVVHRVAKPGEQRRSAVSARRAREVLGWQPQVDLQDGLRATLKWFATGREC